MNREIKKASGKRSEVLRKLRAFLDKNEPELVYFLHNLWQNQGKAITYKELREAIMSGDIDEALLKQWNQDYSRFVVQYLVPSWEKSIAAAAEEIAAKYPDWAFNPMSDGVKIWTATRSAEFVTNSTLQQIEGLRAVVRRAATLQDINVDHLARAVRPMVGLYKQQAVANLNYYQAMIESGVHAEKALERSINYAARQHRYRGYLISRTELAFAYNKGSLEGTRQAQEAGYMGKTVKVWCTADDERTCEICGALEGKTVGMDDGFGFETKLSVRDPLITLTPPAHPSCRCTLIYEEATPPLPIFS